MSALTMEVFTVADNKTFFRLYGRMAALLARYLGRTLGFTAIAAVAVVAAMLLGVLPLQAMRDNHSGALTATPAAVERTAVRQGETITYNVGGAVVTTSARPSTRAAVCWTGLSCFSVSLMDFTLIEPSTTPKGVKGPVIVRTGHGDINPFWPYLSDLELIFFIALILSAPLGFMVFKAAPAPADEYLMKQGDFALVQMNAQLGGLVRAVGRGESRKLNLKPPVAPIFVTGLARSGTTTVLNALTRSREVGSHQYRDFPFLGAPLTWNRLQGAISKEAAAVERPHKDRIKITKLSPEAFEEPLWQHFFPQVHNPAKNQRLTRKTSHPKFEAFFKDHLAKILHLRGADRYVSKGNYNVGRLEYLAQMFPDATFIIPIRAPLDHVASLLRQHQLFTHYAKTDPRVPSYLAATGHYEFGPQRQPICLANDSLATINSHWAAGDDVLGYARQWAEVYGHVAKLQAADPDLAGRLMIVRYEDFCAAPSETLAAICKFTGLADPDGAIAAYAETISISDAPVPPEVLDRRAEIDAIVGPVAATYGYTNSSSEAVAD